MQLFGSAKRTQPLPGPPEAIPSAPQQAQQQQQEQRRVVRLSNMVTRDELLDAAEYADIVDDIKLEVAKYGKLISVHVPRPASAQAPVEQVNGLWKWNEVLIATMTG